MGIDPSYPTAVEMLALYHVKDFIVGGQWGSRKSVQESEQLSSSREIAACQLANDERMHHHSILPEK